MADSYPPLPNVPIRRDWLATYQEPILEPDLPIIDPHHHLWVRPGSRYLLDELLSDINTGHNIKATVFVEANSMMRTDGPVESRGLGQTEFANGIAAMSASGSFGPCRVNAAIVGFVPLTIGAKAKPVLEAHLRIAGDRFRGIRNIVSWDAVSEMNNPGYPVPQGVLLDKAFREGFACLAPLGLTYDAWQYHPQLPEVVDLARAFPETKIVVNHVGGPLRVGPYANKLDEVFRDWTASIKALAACPNVYVKLGGLGMRYGGFGFHEKSNPPSSQDLANAWKPFVDTCIQAFGASRCMFESNFPPDNATTSYPVIWNAFKRLASGASAAEKADLFFNTASRFYRLGL